jgi:hypothetical protein
VHALVIVLSHARNGERPRSLSCYSASGTSITTRTNVERRQTKKSKEKVGTPKDYIAKGRRASDAAASSSSREERGIKATDMARGKTTHPRCRDTVVHLEEHPGFKPRANFSFNKCFFARRGAIILIESRQQQLMSTSHHFHVLHGHRFYWHI